MCMEIYHLQSTFNYTPYLTLKTILWGWNDQHNNYYYLSKETEWLSILPTGTKPVSGSTGNSNFKFQAPLLHRHTASQIHAGNANCFPPCFAQTDHSLTHQALPQGPEAKAGLPGAQVPCSLLYSAFWSLHQGEDGKVSRASLAMPELWTSLAL